MMYIVGIINIEVIINTIIMKRCTVLVVSEKHKIKRNEKYVLPVLLRTRYS